MVTKPRSVGYSLPRARSVRIGTMWEIRQMTPPSVENELDPEATEYARLVEYIRTSFRRDGAGQFELIPGHTYGPNDAFYEAPRVYSFLYTCNTWTNNALKAAGQRACLWTPTDKGIFGVYKR